MTVACMGGHCLKRSNCTNYHAEDRREPAERLCLPGDDGVGRDVEFVVRLPGAKPQEEVQV